MPTNPRLSFSCVIGFMMNRLSVDLRFQFQLPRWRKHALCRLVRRVGYSCKMLVVRGIRRLLEGAKVQPAKVICRISWTVPAYWKLGRICRDLIARDRGGLDSFRQF